MEVTLLLFWLVVYLFACLSVLVSHFERGHGPIPAPLPPPPAPSHCTPFHLPWPVSLHSNFEFQEPNAQSICPLLINVALAWIFTISKYFLSNSLTCDWSILAADRLERVIVLTLWLVEIFLDQEFNQNWHKVEIPLRWRSESGEWISHHVASCA